MLRAQKFLIHSLHNVKVSTPLHFPAYLCELWFSSCSSLEIWVLFSNISEPFSYLGEQRRSSVMGEYGNIKVIITEIKWKQKMASHARHPSHSGFLLRVFEQLLP
jgi:hypothetical protein